MMPVLPQLTSKLSLNVIVGILQLSVPVAIPVTDGSLAPVHSTVASAGTLILGGLVSTTVMVCTVVKSLPQASVAL